MYYIYHIPGIKIGVSSEPEKRTQDQGFTSYEVLEVHTDIYEVSDREQELQRQYGLPVDKVKYHISIAHRSIGGKKGGRLGKPTLTFEQYSEFSKANANTPNRLRQWKDAAALSRIKVTCPHCNKTGSKNVYLSKHFDNCIFNPNDVELVRFHLEVLAYSQTHSCLNTSQTFNINRRIVKMIKEHYE